MKYIRNEDAVSPVIGVILMVVITVIIAAVLAVFAFGVGAPTDTPTASLKITSVDTTNTTTSGDVITVQHYGGDTLRLKDVKFTVETLNGDGVIMQTSAFDIASTVTGQFSAGDTISIIGSGSATSYLSVNGVAQATGNVTRNAPIDLGAAGTESVRVTIIDTPSGSVLSKPAVKIN